MRAFVAAEGPAGGWRLTPKNRKGRRLPGGPLCCMKQEECARA